MGAAQAFEAVRSFEQHEHRDLAWGLARIHEAAAMAGTGSHVELRRAIREIVGWASTSLEPHMAWEETWLYPQIELVTRTPWSTSAARFDHGQIATLVARLRLDEADAAHTVTPAAAAELRCHLFALEALLRAHIEREERLLLPVLDEAGQPA
jgi:hypothetical protein